MPDDGGDGEHTLCFLAQPHQSRADHLFEEHGQRRLRQVAKMPSIMIEVENRRLFERTQQFTHEERVALRAVVQVGGEPPRITLR